MGTALTGPLHSFETVLFDGEAFWYSRQSYAPLLLVCCFSQKCQGIPFFPDPARFLTFVAAPVVLTLFARSQNFQGALGGWNEHIHPPSQPWAKRIIIIIIIIIISSMIMIIYHLLLAPIMGPAP